MPLDEVSLATASTAFLPWLEKEKHHYDIVIINGLCSIQLRHLARFAQYSTPYVLFPHGMLIPGSTCFTLSI